MNIRGCVEIAIVEKCHVYEIEYLNSNKVVRCWHICYIQYSKEYGDSHIVAYVNELQKEFPGAKGYSAANLWRMRNFYLTYYESEKLAPLVREISWSNNVVIMEKCKDDLQREFYIQMTKRYGWTKRVLTNFDLTLPAERRVQAKLAVKDEYTFDFAELSPEYSEHELEMQLVNNVRTFLIEMSGDFTFIGNQYHMVVGSRDLYIDLLLFHRKSKDPDHLWLKMSDEEILKSAGLWEKDFSSGIQGYNLAGVLLFGKDEVIRSCCPGYITDAIYRVENLDRYDDRDIIKTNLKSKSLIL